MKVTNFQQFVRELNMKIIAFYLPQFHSFLENDVWWGKGFTEWTNVKSAKPLFRGHKQPRRPMFNNYYNLLDVNTIKWQSSLAKEFGIYGFCYYHYWFDGKMLMEKPMQNMLANPEIDFPFCICWANEDWTRQWAKKSKEILISQTYGGEDEWKCHFDYLLPFLLDSRYIKIDNMPLIVIYRPEIIPQIKNMISYWKKLAIKNGIKGLKIAYQQVNYNHLKDKDGYIFDYGIEYQPGFVKKKLERCLCSVIKKSLNVVVNKCKLKQSELSTIVYSYDSAWKYILKIKPRDEKMIPGAFVDWDNTPRYKRNAIVYKGWSAEKFKYYLSQQIVRTKKVYKKDMIFLFAWNEWGEGGYLEPDEDDKYTKLHSIKNALLECDEFPY